MPGVRLRGKVDVDLSVMLRRHGGDVPVDVLVSGITSTPPPPPAPPPVVEVDYVAKFLEARPFYVAHRLGGHDWPEHTMEGLRGSLEAGFKAVEFSTYITKDNIFVGSHDWTTERTTGVKHEIWNTDWATIQELNQAGGKLIRLEDLVAALPEDVVVFLDHKGTSAREVPSQGGLESENLLFSRLNELFVKPQNRIVWKVFAEASSAERARQRGYRVNCMLYESTMPAEDYSRWDILGLELSSSQQAWTKLKSVGKPTVGHIIYNQQQARTALERGADGLMVSAPKTVHP